MSPDRPPALAPTEAEALARLRRVQGLSANDFDAALRGRLGTPMAGVFAALIRSLRPEDSDDAVAEKLHLMMLAWLMATDGGEG
jgi:hypothetical protein